MLRKLAFIGICLAFSAGSALAQDAATVIANAKKALGDPKSVTYSGSAKDVAFQQCGANTTQMTCQGPHNPMRPINNYVRAIDLSAPSSWTRRDQYCWSRPCGATPAPPGRSRARSW